MQWGLLPHLVGRSMGQVVIYVEVRAEVVREHLPQLVGDSDYAARMRELHCGLSVRVCSDLCVGVDYPIECSEQVVHPNAVRQLAGFDKIQLPRGQFCRRGFLLQDDKIAAYLGSGMFGEKVVREPHGRHDIAPLHQPFAYGASLLGIEHALRSNEGDDAALAHRIDRFHEEIVVQRARTLPSHGVGMGREKRVEQRHVPERNVAHGHVVMSGVLGLDRLVPLRPHAAPRMQVFQDKGRGRVFLEAGYLGEGLVHLHDFGKDARAGTGVENASGFDAAAPDRIDDCMREFGRSVEGGQNRVLDSVDVSFVLPFIGGIALDDLVQFRHEVGHAVGLSVAVRGLQHLLDSPEAAVCREE